MVNYAMYSVIPSPVDDTVWGVSERYPGFLIRLQRGANGDWELFTRIEMADAMTTRAIEFSDDGQELYWLDARGRDRAAVVAQDMATGALRILAEDAQADCVELLLDPVSSRPLAAAAVSARKRWHMIDRTYAADHAYLTTISTGDLSAVHLSQDKQRWVVYYERDAAPGQYFYYDRTAKQARFLFTARRVLEKAPLVPMQPVVVRARDGLELVCYLSRPRGAAKGTPLPMVLLVHGGPWARDIWALYPTHQWLANRGYAVLSVNSNGPARCTTT